ncbi:cell division protein FtsL [Sulfurihydrogenibium azorense]|jgi:cell division protein FtsL|uniref:Cell division protein FtsL n=1 Tax=Sulfurihydrogenibium azorense (strain DSM 15241 / OCM 825 / Az-Fu1) TaxID=204536 RepID=C1DTV6_SULAA|nr:cell division protein FtsL [Sulfurihydrogenibium azorense]ACN99221.1 putative cell division protein FtsL [Sulfurihydrogenibium azorense Az-Fu1]MDM7273023.1 cell division protein FtsL [Sulfurihydrogenibium azorense]
MIKELILNKNEVLNDVKIGLSRHKLSLLVIMTSLLALVLYSQLNYKIDNEIVKLNAEKNYLIAENFKLKNQITVLSSPERISKIAKQEGGMKKVDYNQVRFIDVNE